MRICDIKLWEAQEISREYWTKLMLAEEFLDNYFRLSATVVQYAIAAVRHDVMIGYKKRKREEVRVISVGVIHGAS